MESKVIGVESLCLEGLVDYSIEAEGIMIYLCRFQGTFACLFADSLLFFARHHDPSMLWEYTLRCPTYLRPGEELLLGLAYRGRHVGNLGRSQIMGSLGDPAIPKTGRVSATPKRYIGRI